MKTLVTLTLGMVLLASPALACVGTLLAKGTYILSQTWPTVSTSTFEVSGGGASLELNGVTYTWVSAPTNAYVSPLGYKIKFCSDGTYQYSNPSGVLLSSGTYARAP